MQKHKVLVRGRIVKMNDAALKIASKHFGAKPERREEPDIPFELNKLPKLDIVTAVKDIKPMEVIPEVKSEQQAIQAEVVEVKKVTRKRK